MPREWRAMYRQGAKDRAGEVGALLATAGMSPLGAYVAERISRCWLCERPLGRPSRTASPNPFLIDCDEPAAARVCRSCVKRGNHQLVIKADQWPLLGVSELAQLGRRFRGDGLTYYRRRDLDAHQQAAKVRQEAEDAGRRREAKRERNAAKARVRDRMASALRELRDDEAAAFRVAHVHFSNFERRKRALPYHGWGPAPDPPPMIVTRSLEALRTAPAAETVALMRTVIDLAGRHERLLADIRERLVARGKMKVRARVEAALLGPCKRDTIWVDELLDDSRTVDEFVSQYFAPGKFGCKHEAPAACSLVRRSLYDPRSLSSASAPSAALAVRGIRSR